MRSLFVRGGGLGLVGVAGFEVEVSGVLAVTPLVGLG
jgi:hypothetical protein